MSTCTARPARRRTRDERARLTLLRNPAALNRLIGQGRSTRQIAGWIGCNRTTVRDALREHGIDPRRGRPHEPTPELAVMSTGG